MYSLGARGYFFSGGDASKKSEELKKNYLWSNEPEPHFHTMYEKRYLDHQTGFSGSLDVCFDSWWFRSSRDATEGFDCDSKIGSFIIYQISG